ncbi:MAG: GAF domain-containing sensor histidine kinase [Nitrosopumilus sp.]|nr:GAF domain-containing sensor histidine kinase [Nitrosopumilus sp.]NNL38093.1 GAF domain-containing sensor histidine kinase [Nitrosopumilus sp.]
MEAKHPDNEKERIKALTSLNILDTPPEEKFDRITKIAQIIFDVPIALVSLVDENRQWFKSCMGLSERETPRSMSFCAHAILNDDVMIIEDATKDERFANNPLVTGSPLIKFYAGKPLRDPNNHMLGTLCIIDTVPRKLSKADTRVLSDLATWVESEFSSLRLTRQLKDNAQKLLLAEAELRTKNVILESENRMKTDQLIASEKMSALGTMSSRLAHDLKNPLTIIKMSSEILSAQLESSMTDDMKMKCGMLTNAVQNMERIIADTLNFVKTSELHMSNYSIKTIIKKSAANFNLDKDVALILPDEDAQVNCDAEKILAVFSNIISNAIQAVDKSGKITISIKDKSPNVLIEITDSGPGILEENLEKIFEPLFTSKSTGTGLGLNICKSIIEQHKGAIYARNSPTTFSVELPKA